MDSRLDNEEIIRARRRQRIMEARRRKRRQKLIRRVIQRLVLPITCVIFVIVLLVSGVRHLIGSSGEEKVRTENAQGVWTADPSAGRRTDEAVANGILAGVEGAGADVAGTEGGAAGTGEDAYATASTAAGISADAYGTGADAYGTHADGYGTAGTGENGGTGEDPTKEAGAESGGGDGAAADGGAQVRYSAKGTENTLQLGGDISSAHAILIDVDSGSILAQKDAKTVISPASMTKILTLLVAAEHVTDLDDTFTITRDITDYSYVNDCSNVGFEENERVTVRDLLYGTILPSGADAAAGLAEYVAGSRESFVDRMNEKLKELGLSGTAHMTNCVGIYDKNHYSTVYDMAMILAAAVNNELCKKVLSAHTYTTSATAQHPEGITISNWFLRRIEDKDTGSEVLCGKTGYVVQSGNCAASYAEDRNGKGYICVTADAASGWKCIYDHVALYKEFSTGNAEPASGS